MIKRGSLIIISAPSGCGKDTVLKEVFKVAPEIKFSISCTSRPKRCDEDLEKYEMMSREQFEKLIEIGDLLEYNEYNGNYYGTRKSPVEKWRDDGFDVVLEIDVNGARNIKKAVPDAVSLFIMPPSFKELENRLSGRGTETAEQIKNRLIIAENEIKCANEYDYICINDDISECARDIVTVIKAQAFTNNKMKNFVQEVEKDAKSFNR